MKKTLNIKQISNMKNLVAAYQLVKSKGGQSVVAERLPTALHDKQREELLQKLQKQINTGVYNITPVKRGIKLLPCNVKKKLDNRTPKESIESTVSIPLKGTILRDKILQQAIKLGIEPLFESTFLDCSHGFRPGKNTRTAVRYIDAKFQSCHYIIEAGFSKEFGSMQHDKLIEILEEQITCPKLLDLIRSELKAGYFEFGKLHENFADGTLPGSILSPLLCNIFLHKLDMYMEEIKIQHNVGIKRAKNKQYEKLANAIKYMRSKGQNKSHASKFKSLIKQLLSVPSLRHDSSYVRIQYIRYADDFIIGVEGSYTLATTIKHKVEDWLKHTLKLKMEPTKTCITKYSKTPVKFLGYTIMAPKIKGIQKLHEVIKIERRTITRRRKLRIRFFMDYTLVLNELKANGFIRMRTRHDKHKLKAYRGTFRGNLVNLDHGDIVRYYSSLIRGLYNYYNFVSNMRNLARICWLLTESCCLTLARKFKLKTMAATYRKFGKDLGYDVVEKKGNIIGIFNPATFKKQNIMEITHIDNEPLKGLNKVWNGKFTKSSLFKTCIICGKANDIRMHHVRTVKNLRTPNSKLDFFTRQMAPIKRKQIPLCQLCLKTKLVRQRSSHTSTQRRI
jgi:retron-type reverse transcriptase